MPPRRTGEASASDRIHHIQSVVERMEEIERETYDLVIYHNSLHRWDNPRRAFKEISRVLKADGKVCIRDSRRDLSLVAKLVVNLMGPLIAGKVARYWKSSIDAPPRV